MNAHTVYLVVAYGVTALLLIAELVLLRVQGRKLDQAGDD